MADLSEYGQLAPETYYIVPDGIPARVLFTVPGDGWVPWIGTYKPQADALYRHVGLTIINVTNLVIHGCDDHDRQEPPIGPTVHDLAAALTTLEPFVVTEAPSDVTVSGFSGKHLELTIPEMPFTETGAGISYPECADRLLKSWIGAPLSYAFNGYNDPGSIEELWILDVNGSRIVISAIWSADAPDEDVVELRSLIESIRIEPEPGA